MWSTRQMPLFYRMYPPPYVIIIRYLHQEFPPLPCKLPFQLDFNFGRLSCTPILLITLPMHGEASSTLYTL
jgi:hypothetical protein